MDTIKDRPPYVQFETRAVEDRGESLAKGCYATKDVHYAIITPQGSRDRIERVASEWFNHLDEMVRQGRFAAEWLSSYRGAYDHWCKGQEAPLEGTPIVNWPAVSPAQVKSMLNLHIRTVEDMATANEETIMRLGMGARALKAKAMEWLNAAAGPGKLAEEMMNLRVANNDLAQANEDLRMKLETLSAQVAALQPKSTPGEPVKVGKT